MQHVMNMNMQASLCNLFACAFQRWILVADMVELWLNNILQPIMSQTTQSNSWATVADKVMEHVMNMNLQASLCNFICNCIPTVKF